ncbi:hypothetical protein E2562_003185 [Oryza meyeriana var. granulata]|uniref:Uncharacterized protein n=1 Tax=Oryza meyeriana var. granulata TaxID=110450 RepID=A0A6G1EUT3_9ORYZ|nr:hypothetical protein E2562_003185 [Oryza meyeriana var. granulata]
MSVPARRPWCAEHPIPASSRKRSGTTPSSLQATAAAITSMLRLVRRSLVAFLRAYYLSAEDAMRCLCAAAAVRMVDDHAGFIPETPPAHELYTPSPPQSAPRARSPSRSSSTATANPLGPRRLLQQHGITGSPPGAASLPPAHHGRRRSAFSGPIGRHPHGDRELTPR